MFAGGMAEGDWEAIGGRCEPRHCAGGDAGDYPCADGAGPLRSHTGAVLSCLALSISEAVKPGAAGLRQTVYEFGEATWAWLNFMNDLPKKNLKPVKTKAVKKETLLETALRIFTIEAVSRGCPNDQIFNFARAGMWLQPKQLEMAAAARMCDHRCKSCTDAIESGGRPAKDCPNCGPRAVGVGGARGGGKSAWMVAQVCLDDCMRYPGLSFLYVRKSAKTLRAQMAKLLRKTIPKGIEYNYREQVGEVVFGNGSVITIRHFKDESEIDNFLGEEYDGIAYEELTTLSQDKFNNLNTCLRTSKKGWRPRIYASWNWGGVGHSWVKKFFYDPWKHGQETTTRYILALVQDNKHIDPEYQSNTLENLVGWKYQSWFLGNPDLAAGNYFSHYREDVHVYPCDCPHCKSEQTYVLQKGIVKCGKCNEEFASTTFQDSDSVRWFGSMDYGSSMPNCFHLFAENAQGDCFTVGEVHTVDEGIEQNAEAFKDLCRMHNIDVGELEFIATGEDVKKSDRKSHDDGSTILTEYRDNGIELTIVHIDRVNAWSQLQSRIGDPERGIRPTWFIHKSCVNLRTQVMTAQYDPKKPNDILKQDADKETGEGGSDALECARNAIVHAYNTVLKNCKAVQAGGFKSIGSGDNGGQIGEIAEIIETAEREDLERRSSVSLAVGGYLM